MKRLLAFACLSLLSIPGPANEVLLRQSFEDEVRFDQNLPHSAAWYGSSPGIGSIAIEDGALILAGEGIARHGVAYFANLGEPVTLNEGESLLLRFKFKPESEVHHGRKALQFGLFDSNGDLANRSRDDAYNPKTNTSKGYAIQLRIGGTKSLSSEQSQLDLVKRIGIGGLITNEDAYKMLKWGLPIQSIPEQGTWYDVDLLIERKDAESLRIAAILKSDNGSFEARLSWVDADAPFFSFDTIALAIEGVDGDRGISKAAFRNMTIVKLSKNEAY